MKLVCLFSSLQNIRAQLEELDTQTQCIDDHVTRLEGVTPSGEDEVHVNTHPHQGFIQREGLEFSPPLENLKICIVSFITRA